MADAEKQDPQARSNRVRFFLLSCTTVALLSLCICVVVFERDTFLPHKYNSVVVVDYSDGSPFDGRPFDGPIHVDFESLEAGGDAELNAVLRNMAMSRSKSNGNVANGNAVSADGEKYHVLYDNPPTSFKENQMQQFGVLLQTLMKQPREEFAVSDVVPIMPDVNDAVDVVLVMSRPAEDGVGLQERIRVADAAVGKKPVPELVRPADFPYDMLSSLVRGNFRRPNPVGRSETLRQHMDDARRMLGFVQREQLARQLQDQDFFEEESKPTFDDFRVVIEQGLTAEQPTFREMTSTEEKMFLGEHQRQVVDPFETVSMMDVVPVIQISFTEVENETLQALVDGEKSEEVASSVNTGEQTEGSGSSQASESVETVVLSELVKSSIEKSEDDASVASSEGLIKGSGSSQASESNEKSEQEDSSFFEDSVSPESKDQAETILEGRVEQILIIPAEPAEVKTESTTDSSEVNVEGENVEQILIIPAVEGKVKTESATDNSEVNVEGENVEQILIIPAEPAEVKMESTTDSSEVNVEGENVEQILIIPAVQSEKKTESTTDNSEVIEWENVKQKVLMPAVHAVVKADSTGHSEVKVEVSNAAPIPAPPVKKSFFENLIKRIAEKARSVITG